MHGSHLSSSCDLGGHSSRCVLLFRKLGQSVRLFSFRHRSCPLFRKKRPLILLEILVGLFLMGLLISCLFTSITHVAKVEVGLEKARDSLRCRQLVQTRLQDLFLGSSLKAPLYTAAFPKEKRESLFSLLNLGIDPDPAFSGEVLSRLYLDEEGHLALVFWPVQDETLWRKEILLSNVTECQFQFFGKRQAEDKVISGNGPWVWHERWSKKRRELPEIIRLRIVQKGEPLEFSFFVPSGHIPTYEGKV